MEVQEIKEQLKAIFRTVINNDKWITIHPNGEDGKGKHLLLKDGESPKEAIERTYDKEDKKDNKKFIDGDKRYSIDDLIEKGFKPVKDKNSKYLEKKEGENFQRFIISEEEYKQLKSQQPKEDKLDIKKTTVKMKSGKEKEIEYVDSVPEGYKKLEGAMTAPLGYTWYHNGKSIIDKERKTILVKDKANNSKEQEMALLEELKKLITKVENDKGEDMDDKEIKEVENEKVDKRKLIDEVGGILKGKVDDEIIRTIIGKLEKVAYDKSEAGTADNEKEEEEKAENCGKKVKNEDAEDKEKAEEIKEEVKEDVKNKCKNSVDNAKTDYFAKLNEIYNASKAVKEAPTYVSRAEREQLANDYFAK